MCTSKQLTADHMGPLHYTQLVVYFCERILQKRAHYSHNPRRNPGAVPLNDGISNTRLWTDIIQGPSTATPDGKLHETGTQLPLQGPPRPL